jgi:plastocyanin
VVQQPTPTPVAQKPTPTPVVQQPTPTPTPQPTSQPTQVIVTMHNGSFSPTSLTIKVGTTVIWQNHSQLAHTVTADNGMFDSGNVNPGGTFSFKFITAGSFGYSCNYHPLMTATIVVV